MAVPERSLTEIEQASSKVAEVLYDLRQEASTSQRRAAIRAERDAEISLLMIMRLMTSITEAIEEGQNP